MEEEYSLSDDLGRVIEILIRQWLLILVMTLIAGIVAFISAQRQPVRYKASVLMAATKLTAIVSYEPSIRTQVDEDQRTRGVSSARLRSYVNLVKNPLIAQEVIDKLGDQLNGEDQNVQILLSKVNGELISGSDTIEITITHSNPEFATLIVNEWAKAYMNHINSVYLESGSSDVYYYVENKIDESKENYESAQGDLEEFIANNQQEELNRQIMETQFVVDQLSSIRLNVLNQQIYNLEKKLEGAYVKRRQVDQLINYASDIRTQVSIGGEGAANSNTIALSILKAQAFAPWTESSSTTESGSRTVADDGSDSEDLLIKTSPVIQSDAIIQTSPITMTADAMIDDLDGIIEVLENRKGELNEEIEILSTQIVSDDFTFEGDFSQTGLTNSETRLPDESEGSGNILDIDMEQLPIDQTILNLEKSIDDLGAKLSKETGRHDQLIRARDLARDTYRTLANKEAELTVAAEIPASVINIASPALYPSSQSVSSTKNVAFASVMGFVFGIFIAFAVEFWWGYKEIEPHPIINIRLRRK